MGLFIDSAIAAVPRAVGLATVAVGLAVLGSACITSRGSNDDRQLVDETAFAEFPDSAVIKDVFQGADSGTDIDGGSFEQPSRQIRRYRLSEPVARAEFSAWLNSVYPPEGWDLASRPDENRTLYARSANGRNFQLDVVVIAALEEDLIAEYEITYSVL